MAEQTLWGMAPTHKQTYKDKLTAGQKKTIL